MSLRSLGATRRRWPRRSTGRVRDLVLYVVIAIGIVGSVLVYADLRHRNGGAPGLPLKWLGFVGNTVLMFGYVIHANRLRWRSSKFWTWLGALLSLHTVAAVAVLLRVSDVPLIYYIVLMPLEYGLVATLLERRLGPKLGSGQEPE